MLIGYARVLKADGSLFLDLQMDALIDAGVAADRIYKEQVSSRKDYRPGLEACLKALQPGNTMTVWKLDRLGRGLRDLVAMVDEFRNRNVGPTGYSACRVAGAVFPGRCLSPTRGHPGAGDPSAGRMIGTGSLAICVLTIYTYAM